MRDVRALDDVSFADWFKGHGGSQQSIDRMWDPIGARHASSLACPLTRPPVLLRARAGRMSVAAAAPPPPPPHAHTHTLLLPHRAQPTPWASSTARTFPPAACFPSSRRVECGRVGGCVVVCVHVCAHLPCARVFCARTSVGTTPPHTLALPTPPPLPQFFATKTDASALRMLNGSPAERLLKPIADYIKVCERVRECVRLRACVCVLLAWSGPGQCRHVRLHHHHHHPPSPHAHAPPPPPNTHSQTHPRTRAHSCAGKGRAHPHAVGLPRGSV